MKTDMLRNSYQNNFSIILGMFCLVVVYMHSVWVGGFNVADFGTNSYKLKQFMSLLLMSIVPGFFFLWGYLSNKYFSSDERAVAFMKRKLLQFYPIYFISFLFNVLYRIDYFTNIPWGKIALGAAGVYYESKQGGGGNIFLVVFFVLVTVCMFKVLGLGKRGIWIFTFLCLAMTKILPHEVELCYIQYFGYYSAFFLGCFLKEMNFLDFKWNTMGALEKLLLLVICAVGIGTPILNNFHVKFLEIQYNPNSFEHLFLVAAAVYFLNRFLEATKFAVHEFPVQRFLHTIGNNAYGHFIIHTHIIKLFIYINSFLLLNKVIVQLIVIATTSYLTVYWFLRIYKKAEMRFIPRVI